MSKLIFIFKYGELASRTSKDLNLSNIMLVSAKFIQKQVTPCHELRGANGGKTRETVVLSRFSKIKYGGGSSGGSSGSTLPCIAAL